MRSRVEIERPFLVAGEEGQLYASLGRTDDYLELVLPEAAGEAGLLCKRLADPATGRLDRPLDLRFREGPPPMVCVMALYVDAEEEQRRQPRKRLTSMLATLVHAVPELDFGELLPRREVAETGVQRLEEVAVREGFVAQTDGRVADPCPSVEPASAPAGKTGRAAGDGMWELLSLAYLEKAREMARRGQVHKALRALEELIRQDPLDARARDLQQEIRQMERREKRRRREPFNPQALLEVGFSYLLLERNPEAAEALAQAVRSQPGHHLSHLLLGIALHRVGQRPAARAAYERAARLKPGDKVHLDLMDALEKGLPPISLCESGPGNRRGYEEQGTTWARAV